MEFDAKLVATITTIPGGTKNYIEYRHYQELESLAKSLAQCLNNELCNPEKVLADARAFGLIP